MTTQSQNSAPAGPDLLRLSQLSAVRLIIILALGVGYASTMGMGQGNFEWGHHWGFDPSWYAIQVLFFISGMLALRSLTAGRTGLTYLKSRTRGTLPLLALYTGAIVTIVFPLLAAPEARSLSYAPNLIRYFVETVTLIQPSQKLSGLMEGAKYDCLIQGAIWTLRWGAVFHLTLALIGRWQVLRRPALLLLITLLGTASYAASVYYSVSTGSEILRPVVPGLKLGYAFAAGMCVFAWRDHLPKTLWLRGGILAGLAIIAAICAEKFPASIASDIFGSAFWSYLALLALQTRLSMLDNWPNLVVATFLGIWPSAQIILQIWPDIAIGGVVAGSLLSSLAIAYALHIIWKRVQSRQSLAREIAV